MTPQSHPSSTLLNERWLLSTIVIILTLYVTLLLLRPSGEGFGRGWNLVAFWFYASPTAVLTGAVALWRALKSRALRPIAVCVGIAALAFPLVAMLVMQTRA